MTWLFSKAMMDSVNLPCSPEPEVESSEATCSDGEPYAQLNVMPTPHKFWRNDKTMDACHLSRFGLTSKILTESHGEAVLMSFLAGFPAKIYRQPDAEQESKEGAPASGLSSLVSLGRYDPDSSTWKTPQSSLLGGWDEFSETWPQWGTMQNGECWEQMTRAHRTVENESGLWRTPTVGMLNADRAKDPGYTARKEAKGQTITLADQVRHERLWPTPTVCGNYNRKGASKTSGDGLATVVRTWPTPVASMHKGSSPATLTRKTGASRENDRLDHAVMASDGGQLNPTWVEWLMGWPIGWTDLKPLAMDKFREWRQQHGKC